MPNIYDMLIYGTYRFLPECVYRERLTARSLQFFKKKEHKIQTSDLLAHATATPNSPPKMSNSCSATDISATGFAAPFMLVCFA